MPKNLTLTESLQAAVGHERVDQVAYLVPDLESGIAEWNALLGEAEWLVYSYSPDNVPELGYRGEPGRFSMRLALRGASPQIELIEPLDGPSIYHDWINERGYGLHHIGRFVPDLTAAILAMRAAGVEPAQWGRGYGMDGDGGFAYYELGSEPSNVIELIEVPKNRRPSETL